MTDMKWSAAHTLGDSPLSPGGNLAQEGAVFAYQAMARKFLSPGESNRSELLDLIASCFAALGASEQNHPFVGSGMIDNAWMADFEEVPSSGMPAEAALRAVVQSIRGQIRWHERTALHNVTPPVLLETVAISAIAALYNGNGLWDFVSGGVLEVEQQVVRQLASLAGWESGFDGVFTFGGKAGILYAIRLGLNRAIPNGARDGLAGLRRGPVVITGRAGHYSIETAASVAGLGTGAVRRAALLADGRVDMQDLERIARESVASGNPIAALIVSGGDTLNGTIDSVEDVVTIVDRLVKDFRLSYRPWIHHDTALGWPWMFFNAYDFDRNPLGVRTDARAMIAASAHRLAEVRVADSFAVDFHKIGCVPYVASVFMARQGAELHSNYKTSVVERLRQSHGENFLQHHTIEHSRACGPVLAAWVALQSLGVHGFQSYIANLMDVACTFRDILPTYGFEVINPRGQGFCTMCWPAPPSGPTSWDELLRSDSDVILRANEYTHAFFRYAAGLDGNEPGTAHVLGYVPSFAAALNGAPLGALRIYPMSPHIRPGEVGRIARDLQRARQRFDRRHAVARLSKVTLHHVPH